MSHTPGPWEPGKQETGGWWLFADKRPVALVKRNFPYGEDEANLRLIASAPDLLEALKVTLPFAEDQADEEWRPALEKARASIAKAEGTDG